MTVHHIPLELNSDFYGLNLAAVLELETDEQPVSRAPDTAYEPVVVWHRLVVNGTPVSLPLAPEKAAAVLREYLDTFNEVPA
ncbi:hypothetical protein [Bordetella genomosp. 11]|uniref:Uncharacterized protein n=1 Tax=Bordetella genomosp. 11 TaxID=1416808 RepID=A0A261UDC2_9BORD|nr:hypothetical protein [Bordetella genomosp. 11]OZI59914.1 hypothetical protein CAL28_10520 [Bordetella genomosp. 11]